MNNVFHKNLNSGESPLLEKIKKTITLIFMFKKNLDLYFDQSKHGKNTGKFYLNHENR